MVKHADCNVMVHKVPDEGVDEGPVQVPMNDPLKGTEALTKDFFASSKTMQDLLDVL